MIFKQALTFVSWSARVAWVLLVALACVAKSQDFSQVPGVVIDDSPKSTNSYIGSPSIAILPNGDYIASHDYFGPGSTETTSGVEKVFISHDKGATWSLQSTINGQFWSSLFVYNNDLYIFGMQSDAGTMVIRKSTDNGVTWTTPSTLSTGLIRTGAYGSAPNQMQIVDGRLWLAASYSASPVAVSAPVGSNLLLSSSWTVSNVIPKDPSWFNGQGIDTWSESQVVPTPGGSGVTYLPKIKNQPCTALIKANPSTGNVTFNAATDFVAFPGGEKKFVVEYDSVSQKYYALSNPVLNADIGLDTSGDTRNTAAIMSSTDLRHWTVNSLFLYAPDLNTQAFQYLNYAVDGNNLAVVSRTAYADGLGGAHSNSDNNLMTFHTIKNFRTITPTQVLVADTNNNRVLRYEVTQTNDWAPLGNFELGNVFSGTALTKPMGVVQDAQGNVYIGEQADGGRILKFDAAGNFLNVVAKEGVNFTGQPESLTIDSSGRMYMSVAFGTNLSDKIYTVDPTTGSVSLLVNSTYTGGTLNNPRGIAVDNAGHLYVADRDNNKVRIFNSTTGAYLGDLTSVTRPQEVEWDSTNQRLIVSSGTNGTVSAVTTGGATTSLYTVGDIGSALGVDTINGSVYLSDFNNGKVYDLLGTNSKVTNVSGLSGPGHMINVSQPDPTVCTWIASGTASFSDLSNWYYWGQPNNSSYTAMFGSAATANSTVQVNENFTLNGMTFRNSFSYTLAGSGSLTLQADTGHAKIDVQQGSHIIQVATTLASDLDFTSASGAALAFNQLFNLAGHTLSVSGTGQLSFNTQLLLNGGTLMVSGETPIAFGSSLVANLNGILDFNPINTPTLGETYNLFDFTQLSAHFNSIVLPTLLAGLVWDSSQLYTNGTLSVVTEHLAGDFNQDGRVNTADISDMLLALTNPSGYQNLSGLTDPSTLLTIEDVNGDGIFTNADLQAFLILLRSGGGSNSVPEPSSGLIAGLFSVCVAVTYKKRIKRKVCSQPW